MKPIDQARNALAFLEDDIHEHAFDKLIWGLGGGGGEGGGGGGHPLPTTRPSSGGARALPGRPELGPGPVEHDPALPPSRDVECRHRVPPSTCSCHLEGGRWLVRRGCTEDILKATVKFEGTDRLGQSFQK
jgi:hypothetical protein